MKFTAHVAEIAVMDSSVVAEADEVATEAVADSVVIIAEDEAGVDRAEVDVEDVALRSPKSHSGVLRSSEQLCSASPGLLSLCPVL
jgi:hypothetical protein